MTLKEMFQDFVDMPPEELVKTAQAASDIVLNFLDEASGGNKKLVASNYFALIGTFIGIDGCVDKAEYAFAQAVYGFPGTYDDFFQLAKAACTIEVVKTVDDIIDASPAEVKTAFVILGMAFCASNGTMTVSEQKLLAKYLD